MIRLNTYINFKDNAREAMEFYNSIFGGTLTMTTFKEGHASQDPSQDNLIMHAQLEGENGILFMASDTPKGMQFQHGTDMSMSLSGDYDAKLKEYWEKLSAGAKVEQPLVQAPWGDTFGMLTDKFGIHWMVNITAKKA